jgi:uncharacterized protein GlcG (DUF336 family)
MNISLEEARRVIDLAREATHRTGAPPVNIAVVDSAAHLVAFERMDGALLGTIDVAHRKARTAALFQQDSAVLGAVARPGEASYTVEHTNGGLISFAGGSVLRDTTGACIGAIGISGASVAQDDEIASSATRLAGDTGVDQ